MGAALTDLAIALAFLAFVLAIYFIPTMVAMSREHHNRFAILVLNVFLGWTFIGWVIALVWALTEVRAEKLES